MPQPKFQVFLSHNSKDKPLVERLAERLLEDYGIRSWVDKWDLVPAQDWEPELHSVLSSCEACAVLLGENGWGNYHLKEAQGALTRQEQNPAFRLIPVLLPKPSEPDMKVLGDFFERTHRVDFANGVGDEQAYQSLVAAIRGRSPGPPLMSVYRILRDAERWHQSPLKDKSRLYLGRNLQDAQRVAQQHTDQLSELAVRFLSVSALQEQRSSRRRNTILIAVLIVVASLALVAFWQRNRAVYQANIALARQLAAQAEVMRNQQANLLPRGVLLAVEAARRFPSLETEQALRHELDLLPRLVTTTDLGAVTAATCSPDGQYLATASDDQLIRVKRISDGGEITRVPQKSAVRTMCYSLDGRCLIAVSREGWAQVLEANSGKEIAFVKYPGLMAVALNSDGRYVAISDNDKIAQVLETNSGREIARYKHGNLVNSVALSPDAHYLATASDDNSAHVWELENNREVARFPYKQDVTAVAFSSDGRYLATASNDTVQICGAPHFEIVTRITIDSPVWKLAFSGNGRLLAMVSADQAARVWMVRSGREVARVLPDKEIDSLSLSPDGLYLTGASNDGVAWRWELTGGQEVTRIFHEWGVWSVDFSPDGRYLATASDDKTGRICEVESGKEAARITQARELKSMFYSPTGQYLITSSIDGSANPIARVFAGDGRTEITGFAGDGGFTSAFFSPDEEYLVALGRDDTVRVWEVATHRTVAVIKPEGLATIAFDPSGDHLVTASQNGIVQRWDVDGGELSGRWINEELGNPMAFSPDGKYLASLAEKDMVRVWETVSGRKIAQMKNDDDVDSLVFSPDGENLAALSTFGKTVRLWFTKRGKQVAAPLVHFAFLRTLAFSHDGRYLATGDEERNLTLWEANTGRELARLPHDGNVSAVAFSPDGRYLATASMDGVARVWRLRAADLIDAACSRLTRNLTLDEWGHYLGGEAYCKTCANLP